MKVTGRVAGAVLLLGTLVGCGSEAATSADSSSGPITQETALSASSTSTSTSIWTPGISSSCPAPYQPVAHQIRPPSQGDLSASGELGDLGGVGAKLYSASGVNAFPAAPPYPGVAPTPPADVDVPGTLIGVVEYPDPIGTLSIYSGPPEAWTTFWLVNSESALAFNNESVTSALGRPYLKVLSPSRFFTTADGAAYAEMYRSDRSGLVFFRWRIDDPCPDQTSAG